MLYFYPLDISYMQSSTKSKLLKENDYLEGDCCLLIWNLLVLQLNSFLETHQLLSELVLDSPHPLSVLSKC